MKTAKVKFSNGDTITTNINGTVEEIKQYYAIGKEFNIGTVSDKMATVESCEVIGD